MSLDTLIKGRIAEEIVEEMLRKAGYTILPFGIEKTLNLLTTYPFRLQRKSDIYDYDMDDEIEIEASLLTEEKLRNLPDFLVVKNRDKETITAFIEVKFRSWVFQSNDLWNYYNAGNYVIVVAPKPPYFTIGLVLPPVKKEKLKEFCEEQGIPEPNTLIDLKGNPYFPEFNDNFYYTPFEEMIQKYLVKEEEKSK